eukprot:scaffold98617_cov25-Phaeocystis_antarctica.AAC.1
MGEDRCCCSRTGKLASPSNIRRALTHKCTNMWTPILAAATISRDRLVHREEREEFPSGLNTPCLAPACCTRPGAAGQSAARVPMRATKARKPSAATGIGSRLPQNSPASISARGCCSPTRPAERTRSFAAGRLVRASRRQPR